MIDNPIFTTILICVLLISFDVAFYYLRRKNHADGKTLTIPLEALVNRVKSWLAERTWGQPNPQVSLSPSANLSASPTALETTLNDNIATHQTPTANTVAQPAARTDMVAMMATSIPTIPVSPEAESAAEKKTVRIQFSADIPEGTTVQITLEVVSNQGKVSFQKSLSAEGNQESVVFPVDNIDLIQPTATASEIKRVQQLPLVKSKSAQAWSTLQNQITIAKQFISKIRQSLASRTMSWNYQVGNLDHWLLLGAIAIYALMVSLGIDRYPIYFFTDEAIHMNLASNFLRDGFKNYYGELMPTFFTIEGWVNGTSVYLQVLPFVIFGKSVVLTRLVSAFVSLLGALAASLLLRDAFKLKYYWVGIFLVITTPAWFLHSRTAFEYVEVGSFYSIFLYFYSRYRTGYLRSLYWAIIAGALCFYTHGLGQILMGVTGLAFFVVDFRYHIHPERRKTVLNGLLLGTILLLPFARYYLAHPGEAAAQVKRRGSYWVDGNLTLLQRLGEFFGQYAYGLTPNYWYFPNNIDLSRHIMDSYGNGFLATLPLVIVGLLKTLRNFRQPAYRIVLIAFFAAPIPASVVAIGMPRMLWMTIPLALLGSIGLVALLEWAETRWRMSPIWISRGLFIVFAALGIFMLRDALVNGPIWFTDYSLYGMQYGAKQVFQDVVQTGLEDDPNRRYVVSPSWANGTEQFVDFFIPTKYQSRISMGQPIDFISTLKTNPPNLYFVATSDEYDKLVKNPKFKDIKVDQILPFPDGRPGFYVITLKVSDNIDQIIVAEQLAGRQPVEDQMLLSGQTVRVIHSPLGGGRLEDIFDNNPDTLAKVLVANPFIFDLYLSTPIDTQGVTVQIGSLPNFTVTVSLYAPGATEPVTYSQTFKDLPPDPLVTLIFDQGPAKSARIYLEIKDNTSGETSQIHVRTVQFK